MSMTQVDCVQSFTKKQRPQQQVTVKRKPVSALYDDKNRNQGGT